MWILLILILIGIGTVIGYLKEHSKQNKRIIELLEKLNKEDK